MNTKKIEKQLVISMIIIIFFSYFAVFYLLNYFKILGFIAKYVGVDYVTEYSDTLDKESCKETLYKELEKVDSKVVDSFLLHYGQIKVLDKEDFATQLNEDFEKGMQSRASDYNATVAGYCGVTKLNRGFEFKDNYIVLKQDSAFVINLDAEYVDITLQHEFGHYIDYVYYENYQSYDFTPLSSSNEFKQIWYEERYYADFLPYFRDDLGEYFAESYNHMKTNPYFQQRCPKTCAFIQNAVNNLKTD